MRGRRPEHVHLTADEVPFQGCRPKLPEISRATVYNTLGELVSLGEVLEVATTSGPSGTTRTRTSRTTTWSAASAAPSGTYTPSATRWPTSPDTERFGFTVSDVEVTYRGVCPNCAAA
ncbi:Transcriptional repressor OS=Streptomyces alboniger OX=132473 GN=CP975_23705 PE=3 SV=1 [Streptomyces alboniger]